MKEIYKGHTIVASAWQMRDTQQWQPKIVIIWPEQGTHPIKTPYINKFFFTREQAEREGLAFAKKWIDDGKPSIPPLWNSTKSFG